jgi:hypothetical protein
MSERLNRRSCPSQDCGVVGQLFFREGVVPLEERDEWIRITPFYAAICENGANQYVDRGNTACNVENGVVDAKFAEWVHKSLLSEVRPPDPAETASESESLVAQSDDFAQHRNAFAKLANQLINEKRCSSKNFREQGGFWKSVNEHHDSSIYFIYCDGMKLSNKIYVNAETSEILD